MDGEVSNSFKPKTSSFRHFLFRVAILALVLALIPSVAPEFVNSALHGRSWEFLQLIFVGLAVSYGLFSKKNDESDKEYSNQSGNSQTYLSRLLHASSVFDDEGEPVEEIEGNDDTTKAVKKWELVNQTESPVTVIAKEKEKPLFLPVRTLKQGIEEQEEEETKSEFVLPSPIPWRSRSKEMKETFSIPSPPPPPPPPPPSLFKSNSGVSTRTFRSMKEEEEKGYEEDEEGVVESSESSDSEDEKDEYENRGISGGKEDLGPDVDKKADEFIAKFREQIRLQRIESIRRSTAQRSALASSKGSSFT